MVISRQIRFPGAHLMLSAMAAAAAVVAGCESTGSRSASADPVMTRGRIHSVLHNTWVRVDYDNVPIQSVLEELEFVSGVDFLPLWDDSDWDDLNETHIDGLQPDAVVDLHLSEPVRLVVALELILDQASQEVDDATWQLGENWVEVGGKDDLNRRSYIIAYPVEEFLAVSPVFRGLSLRDRDRLSADLAQVQGQRAAAMEPSADDDDGDATREEPVDEHQLADEIADIITSTVEQFQWERNGGEGGLIRYLNGVFIIKAPDYIHRQLGGYHFVGSESLFIHRSPVEPEAAPAPGAATPPSTTSEE